MNLVTTDADQRNFLLALTYKNEGILKSVNKEIITEDTDVKQIFDRCKCPIIMQRIKTI